MAIRTSNSAETWEKIYTAFSEVSFVSYDFETIRQSLIDYTRIYYSEVFNDIIDSSEYIAILEMFAYIAEQLAYRVDMVAHENFITTAQRKQSILRLAKLISYKATRNIPVRGLVKLNTVATTEQVFDSRGTNLAGVTITWNDPNNSNWKEQFILVMNRVMSARYGLPSKSFQVGDVVMDLYALRNNPGALRNGVHAFTALAGLDSYNMELVPADIDENGPYEREPDLVSPMSIIFANDGIGDGSDYTGFLMYTKQGVLTRVEVDIEDSLPDRYLDFAPHNVNQTDIWVQQLENDQIVERWEQVETIDEQNLVFNDMRATRKKYEVDTLENDRVKIIFGDGDFSDIPKGIFRFWMRQSANRSLVIQKSSIQNERFEFTYTSGQGNTETASFAFSLTTTLQNGSASETIEHIRGAAPSTYYAQNRMVNGQDYNTYPLKDPSILRLKAINRTFAGQPKYIDWNDASGMYENVKIFGDDLVINYRLGIESQTTSVGGQGLIDSIIEPLLSSPGVLNSIIHFAAADYVTKGVISAPRRKFIEDNRGGMYRGKDGLYVNLLTGAKADGSLKEKTAIQALVDRHWYGEPLRYVQDERTGRVMALIPDPDAFPKDDSRIYAADVPRTIDGVNPYPPGDVGSGLQPIAEQDFFALRYNRYMQGIGNGYIRFGADGLGSSGLAPSGSTEGEVWTIQFGSDGKMFTVHSNLRGAFTPQVLNGNVTTYSFTNPDTGVEDVFFNIHLGDKAFEPGDAFIIDTTMVNGVLTVSSRHPSFPWANNSTIETINLNGWWELMGYSQLPDYAGGIEESKHFGEIFTSSASTNNSDVELKQHSWMIFIKKIRQQPTNSVIGYEVHHRNLELEVYSPTTKFWYNTAEQIIDGETKNRVFDNIKILRSNRANSKTIKFDVAGAIINNDGITDVNRLMVVPSDLLNEDSSGDLVPDHMLQFEDFIGNNYVYYYIGEETPITNINEIAKAEAADWGDLPGKPSGTFVDKSLTYGRRQSSTPEFNETVNDTGLDFMWQHFSPFTNIIDPSVTNIHDIYVMTRGYYDNVVSYIRGLSDIPPTPPTPLELRNSYGYLMNNKMLSDTVVMHPGKLRLMFGSLAEPQLRARFKVVKTQNATITNERLKEEILDVINGFFDIENWDFGETFYATKLFTMIHQRLPNDIASVVLVPVYSTNSFGSLFTVEPGFDEILFSAAELTDIDIVEALTPTVMRQSR